MSKLELSQARKNVKVTQIRSDGSGLEPRYSASNLDAQPSQRNYPMCGHRHPLWSTTLPSTPRDYSQTPPPRGLLNNANIHLSPPVLVGSGFRLIFLPFPLELPTSQMGVSRARCPSPLLFHSGCGSTTLFLSFCYPSLSLHPNPASAKPIQLIRA